jgi:hypothetical protein
MSINDGWKRFTLELVGGEAVDAIKRGVADMEGGDGGF